MGGDGRPERRGADRRTGMNPENAVTGDERRPQRSGGPAPRVAPGRAVPRRERRPRRLAGAAPTTPARQRRPQTRSCHYRPERPAKMAKAKDSRPVRRRESLWWSSRRKAGACRLSSPAHEIMPADSVRARGLPRQTSRPQERAGTARGTERVISPAQLGALWGGAPLEGVARDAKRLALRGRLSPS